ncbi:helix-turn-helix transcriptional regulator [Streptomyces microflavus]|uniref:helix-turn-helix transcriptional regulator n=1 Tax=Streptomyces microflavus TaxID=1919 RepID=UPI0036E7F5FD
MKRPMLTQREAAAACGVSRSTIRRRREAGDLPGAVSDETRGWLIPVDDLLAAGFRLNAPAGPDATSASPAGPSGHHQEHCSGDQVAALRAELAAERHGRQLAEADAEHLRAQLAARVEIVEHLQRALAVACSPGFTAVPGQGSRTPAGSA